MRRLAILFLAVAMFASALLGTAGAVHAETVAFEPVFIIEPIPVVPIDPALLNQRSLYAVPLYRMRAVKPLGSMNLEYFRYTASESERTYLKSAGYADWGVVGYVSKAWFPGLHPITRWNFAGRLDFLTLTSNSYSTIGYVYSGVIGYALPPVLPQPSGTLNIYRYQRPLAVGYNHISTSFLYTGAYPSPYPAYINGSPQMRLWSSPALLQKISVTPFASDLTGSSVVEISWTATRTSGFVDLLYSIDGGVNYTTIVSKIGNSTGKYNWTVPNVTADDCHIMVRWTADPTKPAMAWSVGTQFKITRNFLFQPSLDFSLVPLLEFPPAPPTALAAVAGDATPLIRLTWEDNSPNEEGFLIQRKAEGGTWADLAPTSANVVGYDDITVAMDVLYSYRVKALGPGDVADSAYSEEAQAIFYDPGTPPEELVPETPSAVAAPTNLAATQMPGANRPVRLTWTASPSTVVGYAIERMITDTWAVVATLMDPAVLTHTDTGVADAAITSASYRVIAIGEVENSPPSTVATVVLTMPETPAAKVIRLRIGQTGYSVNAVAGVLDAAPTIMNSRTMLPIRAVVEGLGGTIAWDPVERKVTATLGANEVAVWIDNQLGRVNSVYMPIDPENPLVMPVIVPPGRTLLPVRFITEKLGCSVLWDGETQEVTITYPAVTP